MAEEEFQESEVIFEETVDGGDNGSCSLLSSCRESRNGKGKRRKLMPVTVPVGIPVSASRNKLFRSVEDYDGDDEEMVPPHIIVGRRVAGNVMAFSIRTGKGRVLKGRDLREFRNLILRVTGFLET